MTNFDRGSETTPSDMQNPQMEKYLAQLAAGQEYKKEERIPTMSTFGSGTNAGRVTVGSGLGWGKLASQLPTEQRNSKPVYSHASYDNLIEETIYRIRELSSLKGGEYAGDIDRLANFRRNATALGLANEQVWAVYAAKHWDAIMQYIKDIGQNKTRERMESIRGRADDLIVYMILFKAIFEDRNWE